MTQMLLMYTFEKNKFKITCRMDADLIETCEGDLLIFFDNKWASHITVQTTLVWTVCSKLFPVRWKSLSTRNHPNPLPPKLKYINN